MTYVNAPIGAGQRVTGPVKPHIACPTTSGTGSETTGISIFTLTSLNAKTGIISRRLIPTVALIDPDVTRTLPANVVASTGFDCMSHALESITARLYPRRLNPAQGMPASGVAGRQSVFRCARHAGVAERRSISGACRRRSVGHRGAHRDDVRGHARRDRVQRGGLPPAAWTLVRRVRHGEGMAGGRLSGRQDTGPARDVGRPEQSFRMALHRICASAAPSALRTLARRYPPAARATPMPAKCWPDASSS